MLTKRENLLETIRGGNPDRYVKGFEAFHLCVEAVTCCSYAGLKPGETGTDKWGVTSQYVPGTPAAMAMHDPEHKCVTDITKWREQLSIPPTKLPEEAWAPFKGIASKCDHNETFLTAFLPVGLFEKMHHFMGMEDTLCNFYEEPEATHDLIDALVEWELAQAQEVVDHLHPEALFKHDDWGSQRNSFLDPDMFAEFLLPAYKKIYGFWKANGVELIIHHCDSYSANLVPYMIEMGIDIWQGPLKENDVPALVKQYGGQISFMGGLNNGDYDKPGTTAEDLYQGLKTLVDACPNQGKHYLIPHLTMGDPKSIFPGIYETCDEMVDRLSQENF